MHYIILTGYLLLCLIQCWLLPKYLNMPTSTLLAFIITLAYMLMVCLT